MSDNTISLHPRAAYAGGLIILGGIAMSMAIQTGLISPTLKDSTFLLFFANSMAAVCGFMILLGNLRETRMKYAVIAISVLVGSFLIGCFILVVGSRSNTARMIGQEFGVVVAQLLFFLFAGGIDDILNAVRRWKHGLAVGIWFGNIVAMAMVVLAWTRGHLIESDQVLTAGFMLVYACLPSTKCISLSITSAYGSRWALAILRTFVIVPLILGWLYLIALIHPECLPGWMQNAVFFANAVAFGISYIIDGAIRGRGSMPWFAFLMSVVLQAAFMIVSGIIGAVEGTTAPLVVGLLCQEALPNIPGAGAIIAEFEHQPPDSARWVGPDGLLRWGNRAFNFFLLISTVICSTAIYFQSIAIGAAGITVTLLQSTPWIQIAQQACKKWAERPARALGILISLLIIASALCVGLSIWMTRGGYSESDLVATWYSIARVPSAISLATFGLLGVALVGKRAPKAWRYLLISTVAVVLVGFGWLLPELILGGIAATIAPGLLMQIGGSVNVMLIYTAFNSSKFREMADEALEEKPASWGR